MSYLHFPHTIQRVLTISLKQSLCTSASFLKILKHKWQKINSGKTWRLKITMFDPIKDLKIIKNIKIYLSDSNCKVSLIHSTFYRYLILLILEVWRILTWRNIYSDLRKTSIFTIQKVMYMLCAITDWFCIYHHVPTGRLSQ
jgi:hypothetical protein